MHGEAPEFWMRCDGDWDEDGASAEEEATNLAYILKLVPTGLGVELDVGERGREIKMALRVLVGAGDCVIC